MSIGQEVGVPVVWPDDVPRIAALATPSGRELFRAFTRVEEVLGHPGKPSSADRMASVLLQASVSGAEDDAHRKAHAMSFSRAPIGDYVEYSTLALDQAYAENRIWDEDNPSWEPPRQRIEERGHDEASVDPLTKLFNRRGLDKSLEQMHNWCSQAPPGKRRFVSILQIDLDDFKRVNDTHGHDGGDRLLEDVAGGIRSNTDIVGARPGGDEFNVAFVTEVDGTEVPEGISEDDMRYLLRALPEGQRNNAGIIAAQRALGFATRLENMLDQIMATTAGKMWQDAELSEADRVRPDPGASIGFGVGGSSERLDGIKSRADKAMYARKHERKLVKALAQNAGARQEWSELGMIELVDWMIDALSTAEHPVNQGLLRTLQEIRGDREPSTEAR